MQVLTGDEARTQPLPLSHILVSELDQPVGKQPSSYPAEKQIPESAHTHPPRTSLNK